MGPSTNASTSCREHSPSPILQQTSKGEVHGTLWREKQYWDMSDDLEGELYLPSQATDADKDCMEFEV